MKKVAFPDAYSNFFVGIVRYPYEMVTSLFQNFNSGYNANDNININNNNNNNNNSNNNNNNNNNNNMNNNRNNINRNGLMSNKNFDMIIDMCLLEFDGKQWVFTLNNNDILVAYTYPLNEKIMDTTDEKYNMNMNNNNNSNRNITNNSSNSNNNSGSISGTRNNSVKNGVSEKIPTFCLVFETSLQDAQREMLLNPFDISDCQLTKLHSLTSKFDDGNKNVVLMAVTNRGDRFYYKIIGHSTKYELILWCVRLRPPQLELSDTDRDNIFEPGVTNKSPIDISDTLFDSDGRIMLMADHRSNRKDSLIIISRDSYQSERREGLEENIESETINDELGIVSIAEMPYSLYVAPKAFCLYSRNEMKLLNLGVPFKGLKEMAVQHALPPKYFISLTYKSVTLYKYLRPLHWLENILLHGNEQALKYFFDKHSIQESEAMLISIVCNAHSDSSGGNSGNSGNSSDILRQRAFELFWVNIGNSDDDNEINRMNEYRLDSMYLFFSRIMRPLWCYTLCVIDETNHILPRYTQDELSDVQIKISRFEKYFLISNESRSVFGRNNSNTNELSEEYLSMCKTVRRCIETLRVLIEIVKSDNWRYIIRELSNTNLKRLESIQFQVLSMNLGGEELIRIILRKLSNHLSSEQVKMLHSESVSFFNTADFLTFLAKDSVSQIGGNNNRQSINGLETGLDYLKQACNYDRFDIKQACTVLKNARYYNGMIDLIFYRCDTLLKRLRIIENSINADVNEINYCYSELKYAWDELFSILADLVNDRGTMNDVFDKNCIDKAIHLCLQQKNQQFLFRFYDWLLINGKISMIFKHSPLRYFEEYLVMKTENQEKNNLKLKQLLAYYEAIGDSINLIDWLNALASKAQGFSLEERYDFLLRGKHFSIEQIHQGGHRARHDQLQRSINEANNNQMQMTLNMNQITKTKDDKYKFGEKLHICRIQMKIVSKLSHLASINDVNETNGMNASIETNRMNTIARLQDKLENLDILYGICVEFKLHECALDLLSINNNEAQKKAVNSFWFAIIKEIVRDYRDNWMNRVQSKLINISKNYDLRCQAWMLSHSELVPFMEQMVMDYASSNEDLNKYEFVIDTMIGCKVSFLNLIYDYSQLLGLSNDGLSIGHVIECIIHLVGRVVSKKANENKYDSRNNSLIRLGASGGGIANPRLGSFGSNGMALVKANNDSDKDVINASRQLIEAAQMKLASNQAQFDENKRLQLEKNLKTLGHALAQHTHSTASILFH